SVQKSKEILQECFQIEINGVCLKPLIKFTEMLSRKWMLFTLMIFPESNPLRYSEIRNRLNGLGKVKISDTTMSQRLNELTENKILTREDFREIPPRVEYQLTNRGTELKLSLQPFIQWSLDMCHQDLS
ncbi:MAG: winged helix-turn-helix transcriptional regulator, partial [Candidatus Hodarchaeales archaeon]